MTPPLVSVVIPAYNQAHFLAAAIQSVLGQSYPRLELIVVNDASPDDTASVARAFSDPRVGLIEHDPESGPAGGAEHGHPCRFRRRHRVARCGRLLSPGQAALHIEFLEHHPDVDVTYNARFNLHHSSLAVRCLAPPLEVGLAEFVLGWPFAPSDMVVRREPLFRVGLFDERLFSGGEDVDSVPPGVRRVPVASVNRALNYRRSLPPPEAESPRAVAGLPRRLETALGDPRCPAAVRALRRRPSPTASWNWCSSRVSRANALSESSTYARRFG